MMSSVRRLLLCAAALLAVVLPVTVVAAPARAATFTTRCVVAREMRIYHTATSSTPGRTKLYFGTTVYADQRSHARQRVWWWTLTEGWHLGWISANPTYTRAGACGQLA